ncbi:OLC1v1002085C1 [Oldenlandia corymbosa var. corymbosa]|uniref:OLC1v1002085C1 n=1 Tax=Oldenlandia corymbosa var. corymbosa TaxID=529605 RepID=A0AAV1D6T2_OLDCO|nr:OLC1v1002085C1 [Oldenlandia corymbosa var. corymbosa]
MVTGDKVSLVMMKEFFTKVKVVKDATNFVHHLKSNLNMSRNFRRTFNRATRSPWVSTLTSIAREMTFGMNIAADVGQYNAKTLAFVVLYLVTSSSSLAASLMRYSNNNPNVPPGSTGYPIIGETIDFSILGPEKFIAQRMKKYSAQVFKTSLLGEKMVVVCGPPGNKFAFFNARTSFFRSSHIRSRNCSIR